MNKPIILPLLAVWLCALNGFTAQMSRTIYINKGIFTTVDLQTFPFYAFNPTVNYSSQNEVISIYTSDTLNLTIFNNDTLVHGFDVKGISGVNTVINPGNSVLVSLHFPDHGVYIYYDSYNYPKYRYMGLGGMICSSDSPVQNRFFWNIKEHEKLYNSMLENNQPVSWTAYYPDYFTINGLSHPDLQNDTSATILAAVGDTVHIFIANTGQSKHSLHFHGFHCRVIYSSASNIQVNSSKDTFPLRSMESMLLELVPDKQGRYSVHDHNLVAVSGGGTHPNGMFTIMTIQ